MDNMLNQFCNYLSSRIIKYYEMSTLKPGEKYYIQFDEKLQVHNLYNSLKGLGEVSEFIYKHPQGGEYRSYLLNIKGIKIIVASTIDVSTGFLVTLRNLVSEQKDQFESTALLILCNEGLDSINSGSSSLLKGGMPLNITEISKSLIEEMEVKGFTKEEKEILRFYLIKRLEEDIITASIWDYDEIYSMINSNTLSSDNYGKIGLFHDELLKNLSLSKMKKRLNLNYELFKRIRNSFEYENPESQLEKFIDDDGIRLLLENSWQDMEFEDIRKSYENLGKKEKTLLYQESLEKITVEGLEYWEKSLSDTRAGIRKRHLIIFNIDNYSEVNISFEFNDLLSNEYLSRDSKRYATVSGSRLLVKLKANNPSEYRKISYTHKGQSKSKYDFNILVINKESTFLENIKSIFNINTKGKLIQINNYDKNIVFGNRGPIKEIGIYNSEQILNYEEGSRLEILNECENDVENKFALKYEDLLLDFYIKEVKDKVVPVMPIKVWQEKRENKKSFIRIENKLIQDTKEYYITDTFKKFLSLEEEIIDKNIIYGEIIGDKIIGKDILLDPKILELYLNIINYYKKKRQIPSLFYMDKKLKLIVLDFIETYNKEIEKVNDSDILGENKSRYNLFKIGTYKKDNIIYYSPLAPINLIYNLTLFDYIGKEKLEMDILKNLKPNNLLPYIYDEKNNILTYGENNQLVQWIKYENLNKVSLGLANRYLKKLVENRIIEFIKCYKYLFLENSSAAIRINLINIKDDLEVIKGIASFLQKEIEKKDSSEIIPVEIKIYNDELVSSFDDFFKDNDIERIEEEYELSLDSKKYDKMDVLRLIQNNIKYFKQSKYEEYEYSHLSFYKVIYDKRNTQDIMSEIENGLFLNGLISNVNSISNRSLVKTGFGTKNLQKDVNLLVKTAMNINELVANTFNEGNNPYRKDTAIVTIPKNINEDIGLGLFKNSNWVTFIEASNKKDFFYNHLESDKIKINYFNEENTITISDDFNNYYMLIEDIIKKHNLNISEEEIKNTVKLFNIINGKLLLNLLDKDIDFREERLSLIYGLNSAMNKLINKEIIWIPLAIGNLNKVLKDVFKSSFKNIKGIYTEDFIFVGIKLTETQNPEIYFCPMKYVVNYKFKGNIISTDDRVRELFKLIKENLKGNSFEKCFYRNLLMREVISTVEKFEENNLWQQYRFYEILKYKEYLLNDKFTVSLERFEGIGYGLMETYIK